MDTMTTTKKTRSTRKNHGLDIAKYTPDTKLSLTQRVAHYLDWAAGEFPKQFTNYNIVLKAIMGYARTPTLGSEEVESLRRNIGRVKQIMVKQYGREVVSAPGLGIRATVDDADTLTTALPRKITRLHSAQRAASATAELIDVSKVPDTAEMKPWKRWFSQDVKSALKTLTSPEMERKLLPPMQEQSIPTTHG